MAGGQNAEFVACARCANKAERTSDGLETDAYKCGSCGKQFLITWDEMPETTQWPITSVKAKEIREIYNKLYDEYVCLDCGKVYSVRPKACDCEAAMTVSFDEKKYYLAMRPRKYLTELLEANYDMDIGKLNSCEKISEEKYIEILRKFKAIKNNAETAFGILIETYNEGIETEVYYSYDFFEISENDIKKLNED